MSADVIPIRPNMKFEPVVAHVSARARVEELELAAVRALAALLRLRDCSDAGDMPTKVIDFSGLEAIPAVREMALDLNAQIDAQLEAEARR